MTSDEYRQALLDRGFHYVEANQLWIGPFNIQVTSQLMLDQRSFANSARDEQLSFIDERLRDKRGLPRPPSSGGISAGLL